MKQLIFSSGNDWVGVVVRLTIGLVMFPHGAQKVFGWFNGPGFAKEMAHLQHLGIPAFIAVLVILTEFLGSISLIVGFAGRLWAIAFIILFLGIIFMCHLQYGFFINWFGKQQGEGYEYHLLVIGLALAVLINGSGRFSVDSLITTR